jgi:hypothetical protein
MRKDELLNLINEFVELFVVEEVLKVGNFLFDVKLHNYFSVKDLNSSNNCSKLF